MLAQQYCLKWKYHHTNLQTMFSQLLDRGCFCDVTLACEGQTLKAHRVVLCACSTYFDAILTNCGIEKDPIVIMKDAKFADIKCLIEFMYKGEINVEHANLASLLKTAEELKIKGLAEVSWREDDQAQERPNEGRSRDVKHPPHPSESVENNQNDSNSQQIPFLTPLRSFNQQNGKKNGLPAKRKRGRPPLDGEFENYSTPKISHVESQAPVAYPDSSHLVSVMMDEDNSKDLMAQSYQEADGGLTSQIDYDDEAPMGANFVPKKERPETPADYVVPGDGEMDDEDEGDEDVESNPNSPGGSGNSHHHVTLTAQERAEWRDVIKMSEYLKQGRRQQFWEETFTKRVMDAIKSKNLEMKKAAQLLGVSYGTLYGRYRETYGCLKHPYRNL
ncbi:protein tramtrack, beta isoform isoform X2 [Lutzomyia longipalpis]|uniref:BTB domain-containing protein n=1 Tax=Lutzomyia longipalpis TaxID=7200 RepID=A0A1B0CSW4_LUTLO|nr:protein tramtrack, beta isoform isoform X2 [Lutzomyia longipalpis]